MIVISREKHGPHMEALIDHPTTLRQADGNRQTAKALVETLVAWLRDSPDCPHDSDEAVAADMLKGLEATAHMNAAQINDWVAGRFSL